MFVFPIIVISITIELMIRQVPNIYKYKYDWMQENASGVEVLIFGSSHSFYGICPKYFDSKAFNLANPSQLIEQDLFLLKYWGDKYKRLKIVIYPISYFSWFSPGLECGAGAYRYRYYSIYMDYDHFSHISPFYYLEIAEPETAFFKFKELFYGTNNSPDWTCDQFGSSYLNKHLNKDVLNGEDFAEKEYEENWNYIDNNYKLMGEFADYCINRGIQLVIVTTPTWHTYYERLNEKQLKKMRELTHRFQREYNIPYFDYLKDSRFTFEDFYDVSHLSDIGAEKFSKIIVEDIHSLK